MAVENHSQAQPALLFSYKHLIERDSIRLILLLPASSDNEEIRCRLIPTTLSECKDDISDHYTALSYVWGDDKYTRTIFVDEFSFSVSANLHLALRDLRDRERVLRLWADALCINQLDNDEKGEQISVMGRIYAGALHTVIYLGSPDPETEKVLNAINPRQSDSTLQSLTVQQVQAASYILSRKWFRRVWVFQELVFSNNPWIHVERTNGDGTTSTHFYSHNRKGLIY